MLPVGQIVGSDNHCEKIRVCFIIDDLARAGTESQLCLWLKYLKSSHISPYLCLLKGFDECSRELAPQSIPVFRYGVTSLLSPRAAWRALQFWQFLRRNRIEVVQTFFPDSTRFAAPVAKAAGVFAVYGSRRDIGFCTTKVEASISQLCNRWFLDIIVANCEAARKSVIEQDRVSADKVIVIPNGIDLDRFQNVYTWQSDPCRQHRRIGVLSNLREVKGIDVFVHAAHKVLLHHPNSYFEIAGKGNMAYYQELIDELGLSENVHLVGTVDNAPNFLASLDVAVLPSRAEGLSNSLLEYMAAGRPIVATDVGGNPELIQDQVNGILVPPNNSSALADGMSRLLNNPRLAERLAVKARSSAQSYSIPKLLERLEQLYSRHLTTR